MHYVVVQVFINMHVVEKTNIAEDKCVSIGEERLKLVEVVDGHVITMVLCMHIKLVCMYIHMYVYVGI